MTVYLKVVNPDTVFHNSTASKIVLNDLSNRSVKDRDSVNNLLMLQVGEVFDNVPRCSCGAISMRSYLGVRCSLCHTVVEEVVSDELDDKVWVRAPDGVPALMTPRIWGFLQNYLYQTKTSRRFNVLLWLTDPDYKPNVTKISGTTRAALEKLEKAGLAIRSYENFYNRFDEYIEFLLSNKEFNSQHKTKGRNLLRYIKENHHVVWTKHVMIPNKALILVEKSNNKVHVDKSLRSLLKGVRLMVGIDNPENSKSGLGIRARMGRTARFLAAMADYYDWEVAPEQYTGKHGQIRKNIIASRTNGTARAVITAMHRPHQFDEIDVPWGFFIGLYSAQIKSRLYKKYKYSSAKILKIMTDYQRRYHPALHAIFNELIQEAKAPNGRTGIPILMHRPPTLKHGSIVLLRVVSVKPDVRDTTVSVSGALVPLLNGDFDGDTLTFAGTGDNYMARAFSVFEPKNSVPTISSPYGIDRVFSIPKQTSMMLTTMAYNDNGPSQQDKEFMNQFLAGV